jgi:protein RecA
MPKRTAAKPTRATKSAKVKVDHLAGLAAAIAGPGVQDKVLKLSDDRVLGFIRPDRVFSTRSIAIDKATRINGFPGGRVVEVYGLNGTGKTTLVLQVCAQVQAMGGVVAYLDSENKLDRHYAKALGVDSDRLLMVQPAQKTVESAIEALDRALTYWIDNGLAETTPIAMVWDSVANLATREELDNPGSKQPGVAAKLLKQAMRTLTEKVARAWALFLITNQMYEKIGAFGHGPGPKRSTTGGEGLRYQATMRLEMIRTGFLKDQKDNPVGIEVLCKFMKNHAGSLEDAGIHNALEVMEETVAVQRGHGFSNAWSLFQKLKEARYITVGGAGVYTFQVKGEKASTWKGGWLGLQELLAQDQELWGRMASLFMGLR